MSLLLNIVSNLFMRLSAKCQICQYYCSHSLNDYRCPEGKAGIMTSRHFKGVHFLFCEIICLLRLPYAGCWLEGDLKGDRCTVGDATVDAASSVFGRTAGFVYRVIVLRAFHCCCPESVTELDSSHAWNCEYRMGEL